VDHVSFQNEILYLQPWCLSRAESVTCTSRQISKGIRTFAYKRLSLIQHLIAVNNFSIIIYCLPQCDGQWFARHLPTFRTNLLSSPSQQIPLKRRYISYTKSHPTSLTLMFTAVAFQISCSYYSLITKCCCGIGSICYAYI
jgi:hypothetical protein